MDSMTQWFKVHLLVVTVTMGAFNKFNTAIRFESLPSGSAVISCSFHAMCCNPLASTGRHYGQPKHNIVTGSGKTDYVSNRSNGTDMSKTTGNISCTFELKVSSKQYFVVVLRLKSV